MNYERSLNEWGKELMRVLSEKILFHTNANVETAWDMYLDLMPKTDSPYRKLTSTAKSEWDCRACHHFFRRAADCVYLDNGFARSVFRNNLGDELGIILNHIADFVEDTHERLTSLAGVNGDNMESSYGTPCTPATIHFQDGSIQIHNYDHFFLEIPEKNKRILKRLPLSPCSRNASEYMSELTSTARLLKESSAEAFSEIIALQLPRINEGLLREMGQIKSNKTDAPYYYFDAASQKGCFLSYGSSTGQLIMGITNAKSFAEKTIAIEAYKRMVDPSNYMRTNKALSERAVAEGRDYLINNGYGDSLQRRIADLSEIPLEHILFKSGEKRANDIFSALAGQGRKNIPTGKPISMETFLDYLKTATNCELFFTSKMTPYWMTMTTADNSDAPVMLKWNNHFAWTYRFGDGVSEIATTVKKHGGNIDGAIRASILWNRNADDNDIDLHCKYTSPSGKYETIFFGHKQGRYGFLDVDIISPRNEIAVENLVFKQLHDGTYHYFVNVYSQVGSPEPIEVEVSIEGEEKTFITPEMSFSHNRTVPICDIIVKNGQVNVEYFLNEIGASNNTKGRFAGMLLNSYIPVKAIIPSPNQWNSNSENERHFFFIMDGCDPIKEGQGLYLTMIKDELVPYRRVIEALASTISLKGCPYGEPVAGLGFNEKNAHTPFTVRLEGPNAGVYTITREVQ